MSFSKKLVSIRKPSVFTLAAGFLFLSIPSVLIYLSSTISQFITNRIDPIYIYYFNGLNYALGRRIQHVDHPGTPLQVYIGKLINYMSENWCEGKLCHPLDYAFHESEKVLFYGIVSLILILMIVLIFSVHLIKKIFSNTNYQRLGFFYLLTWIAVPSLMYYLTGLKPEIFLIILASMCGYLACREAFSYGRFEKFLNPILLGFLVGLGIATKVTFLSFLGLFILLRGSIRKALFLVMIPPSFVLFTWPIKDQYAHLFSWLKNILTHTGSYGTGDAGLPSVSLLFSNFNQMISSHFILFMLILVVCCFLLSRYSIRSFFKDQESKIVYVFMAIMLVQFSMTIKHPSIRYFLPALALLPWMVVFSLNSINAKIFDRFYVILFLILVPVSISKSIVQFQPEIKESAEIANIEALAKKDGCFLYEVNGGGLGTALAIGNIWAAYEYNMNIASAHQQRMISGVYSDSVTNAGNTYTFENQDYEKILSEGCLIIFSKAKRDSIFGLNVSPVFQGQYVSAFNVERTKVSSGTEPSRDREKM